jgi:hypothetical protein
MASNRNIEVGIRSLLTAAEYRRLKALLSRRARFLGAHHDQSTCFDREGRLGISIERTARF